MADVRVRCGGGAHDADGRGSTSEDVARIEALVASPEPLIRLLVKLEQAYETDPVILAIAGCLALILAWRRRRTALGDVALVRLNSLFAGLKNRAADLSPGGQSHDAVLTAALYGFTALPSERFPYLDRVFPKPKSSGDSSGGDSGSSDGGGCGGGCGGCGG